MNYGSNLESTEDSIILKSKCSTRVLGLEVVKDKWLWFVEHLWEFNYGGLEVYVALSILLHGAIPRHLRVTKLYRS